MRRGSPRAWLQEFALFEKPFPKDHKIVRLARKWFFRRVFRAATETERSRDCPPITYREFMPPSARSCGKKIPGASATRPLVWILGSLALAQTLPAETVSAVEKQGRYWVQTEEGSLQAGTRLRVSSTGYITVTGGPWQEVGYKVVKKLRARSRQEAVQLLGSARVDTSQQGGTAAVRVISPNCFQCNFTANALISVPASTQEATLETTGGALKVTGVAGSVKAETGGGSIEMEDIGGDVRAATAGGFIRLGSVGGDVRCETAGGSIELGKAGGAAILTTSGGGIRAGEVKGTLQAETLAGSIRAEKVGGDFRAATSGGSIEIGQVSGSVDADTAGGSINIGSAPSGVHVETAAGNIRLYDVAGAVRAATAAGSIQAHFLAGRPLKECRLETLGGRIVVFLPESLPITVEATVDLANRLNRIVSEFSAITVRRAGDGFGPGVVSAAGNLNGGGPVLSIHNTGGRIQIRKRQ